MELIDIIWGKSIPYKNLFHHLVDTGACARVLLEKGCCKDEVSVIMHQTGMNTDACIQMISYLAMMHDIGKAHPDFQRKADIPEVHEMMKQTWIGGVAREGKFRHEKYSAVVLKRIWGSRNRFSKKWSDSLCRVIELHHQGKNGRCYLPSAAYKGIWEKTQDELEARIFLLSPLPQISDDCRHWDAVCTQIMGIIILADWIASSDGFNNLDASDDHEYLALSIRTAEKTIREFQIDYHDYTDRFPPDFAKMWPEIGSSMRPIQKMCCEEGSDPAPFYIIEAPMGEGKTEAALYLASRMMIKYRKSGLYVALPTSATSNQMNDRVNSLFHHLGLPSSRLLHSTAWAVEDIETVQKTTAEDENALSEWLAPVRRGLLSANAVGTVDQAMMSVIKIRYGVLRLLGLSGKVLIIDEIHAYDAYMTDIIERLLTWCRALEIPVILLSATLTKEKRQRFLESYGASHAEISSEYPLITAIHGNSLVQRKVDSFTRKTYYFRMAPFLNNLNESVRLVLDTVSEGGCVCFMLDTVREAQTAYQMLKQSASEDTKVLLFHSRFLVQRRMEIEKECIRLFGKLKADRPAKAVLVCTQVVEQSLDLDFDCMVTQIAPIDLLLQRAGRVHRHESVQRLSKFDIPIIIVLASENGMYQHTPASYVYAPFLLEKTHEYLGEGKNIEMPDGMREAIEDVYASVPDETQMEEYAVMSFDNQIKCQSARAGELPKPSEDHFYATQSPLDALEWDEDSSEYMAESPRTRDEAGTVRIALLDDRLIEAEIQNPYDKEIAKKILLQSVSLRLPEHKECYPEGKGVLKGCVLIKKNGDGSGEYDNMIIVNSEEIGLTMKRR